MKAIALGYLLLTTVLSLCSYYIPPDDSVFILPPVEKEARLKPQPYGIDHRFELIVDFYCDETGTMKWLVCRMFGQESVGNPMAGWWNERAISWAGAEGIAQLMPTQLDLFAKYYNDGKRIDPFDSETSIRVGIRYLAALHDMTGSWKLALRAYNGGFSHWLNPRKYGEWPQESLDYSTVILHDR